MTQEELTVYLHEVDTIYPLCSGSKENQLNMGHGRLLQLVMNRSSCAIDGCYQDSVLHELCS